MTCTDSAVVGRSMVWYGSKDDIGGPCGDACGAMGSRGCVRDCACAEPSPSPCACAEPSPSPCVASTHCARGIGERVRSSRGPVAAAK